MTGTKEALDRLIQGNRRFAAGRSRVVLDPARRAELVSKQAPYAVVLSCSDSRVPVEMVFDQGLGDLFVIRVAGNIVAPSQINSVEFAATKLQTRLAVVLGHSGCGAVTAALEAIMDRSTDTSVSLGPVIDRVQSAIERTVTSPSGQHLRSLLPNAVRANVQASVDQLQNGSSLLQQLTRNKELLVVGAEYSLETGIVTFLGDALDKASLARIKV